MSNALYAVYISYDEETHKVGSFFRWPTYHVWISIDIRAVTLRTVESSLNAEAGTNLIKRSFLPWSLHDNIEPADSRNLRTGTKQAVHNEVVIPMFVRTGDLYIPVLVWSRRESCPWCALGTSFIGRCIWGLFLSECKKVSWNSESVWILSSLRTVSSLFSDTSVLNEK